eukprot:6787205-Pyramimonas_sp.AAC.2
MAYIEHDCVTTMSRLAAGRDVALQQGHAFLMRPRPSRYNNVTPRCGVSVPFACVGSVDYRSIPGRNSRGI